jgi:hypothetical protein
MKSTLISFFYCHPKIDENIIFYDLEGGSKAIGYHVASFQLDL